MALIPACRGPGGGGMGGGVAPSVGANIRAAQLEAIKAAQTKALAMLRELHTALSKSLPSRLHTCVYPDAADTL